jgi:hypothetical protein
VQLLIQKKTNGIVFDNDAKGCYDRIVSGIALAALRRIVYSKNSVRMLGLLWDQLEHHVATGFGVSDSSYKSTKDKLLYGIGQGSCSSPIVWALLNQLLLKALGEEFDCISLVSVDGITTDTRPGDSFVDDTTTGATDDNHNLDPISSTVRGLKQEEDSLVARMEVIIQFSGYGRRPCTRKVCMVFDRPPLEQGCLKTDSNRTTTPIDHRHQGHQDKSRE